MSSAAERPSGAPRGQPPDAAGPAVPGARLLRLYPRRWRTRYEAEVREVLRAGPPSVRDRLDLVRAALDAHLHPPAPSLIPPIAAISGGAFWTAAWLAVAIQPAPADWPGYVAEMVPLALAGTACLLPAIIGTWLRLGDSAGGIARLAVGLAVAGHLAWLAAIAGVLLRIDYGASTALATAAAAIGTALVGVALARAGDWPIAGLVAAAAGALMLPITAGWLGFALAWTAIGLLELQAALAGRAHPLA